VKTNLVSFPRLVLAVFAALIVLAPLAAHAQNDQPYGIFKGERNENFVLPYGVANHDRKNPVVYTFDEPLGENWIMGIENKVSYTAKPDAKVVVLLRDMAPSEKFVELHMYGGEVRKYVVNVNTPETGYFNIHTNDNTGWATEEAIGVTHVENQGLLISDGRRIVVDKLDVNGFNLSSIEVYGNDEAGLAANAYAGTVAFNLVFGSLEGTPIYYLPGAIMAGVGAFIGILLLVKKRKRT
jgi:hypothetical protein